MEQKAPICGYRQVPVTNRQILAIAIPMTVAYLTTPLVGLVDSIVIGRIGDAALFGGLAAGAMVFDFIFVVFETVRSVASSLVAQAFGRGDSLEERAVFLRAFVIAAISGFALALLAPLIASISEWFINAEPALTAAMDLYIRIRLLSAPAALINYVILGYLVGRAEVGIGLFLQLLLNGMNIALTSFLGVYLGWGIAGVAWGTICAEVAAMTVGMVILFGRFSAMPKISPQHTLNVAAIRSMVHLNGDIMIRSFALMGAYILFMRQSAQLGTATLAANAVLMHFLLFAEYFLSGFATAAQQFAGRAIGAGDRPAFLRAVRLTAGWGFALAGFMSVLLFAFGEQLVGTITKATDVRTEAVPYLSWAIFTAPSGVLAFQMNGVFLGASWSRDIRNMMFLSFVTFVTALFALGQIFGNSGLWAAYHIFLLVRGTSLLLLMRRRLRTTFAK
ncbi:MATE family efflux transporter (plasmid) [Mesorhizobium sp. AR10]|uniref:MATE family efflux transporter n=1 Tax=Mesorhizobium sp. AR10 TaxID=2865839 RepID=UPI00215FC58F|nr:MATE family efflux transporter [Mesorhizobium sp. AR10]UVK35772.1 MATE family efflux transporter [Mesorhizobium sp. AR10]